MGKEVGRDEGEGKRRGHGKGRSHCPCDILFWAPSWVSRNFPPSVFLPLSDSSQEKIRILGTHPFNTHPKKIYIETEKKEKKKLSPRAKYTPAVGRRSARCTGAGAGPACEERVLSVSGVPKFPYLGRLQLSLLFEPLGGIKKRGTNRRGPGEEGGLGEEQPPAIRLGPALLPSLATLLPSLPVVCVGSQRHICACRRAGLTCSPLAAAAVSEETRLIF